MCDGHCSVACVGGQEKVSVASPVVGCVVTDLGVARSCLFIYSRNAATHTAAISSKSTELRVHYNDLQKGIQSPSVLANLLFKN